MSERPAIFFQCAGAQEVCSALRTAIVIRDTEGSKAIGPFYTALGRRVWEQPPPPTDMPAAVREYSITLSAEATQTSEAVSMPPPTTVSYDPSFGSERVAEKARVLASEISDKLRAFLSKQR